MRKIRAGFASAVWRISFELVWTIPPCYIAVSFTFMGANNVGQIAESERSLLCVLTLNDKPDERDPVGGEFVADNGFRKCAWLFQILEY